MKQNERIMVAVAAVVAVVAVVAFVMIRSAGESLPPTGTGTDQNQGTTAPPGMGGTTSKPSGKLVPVPKGTTPSQYLSRVYTLVKEKKYQEAFKLYPDSVQQGGFDAFKSSREGMPVQSFKVGSMTTKGSSATIAVTQTLGGQAAQSPNWVVTWTFKKSKTGAWGVESYTVNMTGGP